MTAQEWPDVMTVAQVAGYLQLAENTVRGLIGRKELPAAKIGKSYRIRKEDVDAYLKQQTES